MFSRRRRLGAESTIGIAAKTDRASVTPKVEPSLRSHETLAALADHNARADLETDTHHPRRQTSDAEKLLVIAQDDAWKTHPQSHPRATIFFYTKRAAGSKALQRFFRLLLRFASRQSAVNQ